MKMVWIAAVDSIYEKDEVLAACSSEEVAKAVCVENNDSKPIEWEEDWPLRTEGLRSKGTSKPYVVYPLAVVGL